MLLSKEGEDDIMEEYSADGFQHKSYYDDPFYKTNLSWMLKSKAAEADSLIRKRVESCVNFYYLFHMDAYRRNAKEVFFYGFPGAFKWYAGGIFIRKKTELTKKWKNIFYNETDADKAYQLLDKMISQQYKWDKSESNWLKQNASVLFQMREKIKEL